MVWCLISVTSRRLNVRNFHFVLFCWYLVILEIIRKLLYILTVLQHLSLEVVVQLSPASVWVSGVIVHLTSKGIHTHHNTKVRYQFDNHFQKRVVRTIFAIIYDFIPHLFQNDRIIPYITLLFLSNMYSSLDGHC